MKAAILIEALTATAVSILVLAIGAVLVELVCLLCAVAWVSQHRAGLGRTFAAGLLLFGLGLAGAPALRAQEEAPQLEARYTRVFGSDTVRIVWQSISPDGRWVAFSSAVGAEKTNGIWLVPTDGGEPIQLTTGTWDIHASWFPTSDRIAFASTKLDESMIMTLAIDPETGAATGTAQRITLDGGSFPRVSPDGESIAYRKFAGEGFTDMAINVIPARGGSSRTVVQLPGRPWVQSWSRDSHHLYFFWRDPDAQGFADLMRVSVDGGEPEKVTTLPGGGAALVNPYRIYKGRGTDASGGPLHVISTADGEELGQVSLPEKVGDLGHQKRITPDGRQVVAVVSNTVTPLRVLPVAGGTGRQLGDARADDIPIGWTPDGQRVVFQTVVDGRVAVLIAPVDEGAAEEYTVIPDLHMSVYQRPVLLSEDARYVAFQKRTADTEGSPLVIARVSDGETRTVTESPTSLYLFGVAGPGGPASMGDEFLYLETVGESAELRAASFDGGSRLVRAAIPNAERQVAGVFGDRVVWAQSEGNETAIMIADGPDSEARILASVPAMFAGLVWSPDGRWLAGGAYFIEGEDYTFKIMLLGVTESGEATGAPRYLDTEIGVGWGIRWLPDSQGLTVFAQSLPSYRTDVWKFSLREGEPPAALTKDETSEFWYYSLSPDGRYIAYPAAVERGSSIWLVDVEDLPDGD